MFNENVKKIVKRSYIKCYQMIYYKEYCRLGSDCTIAIKLKSNSKLEVKVN